MVNEAQLTSAVSALIHAKALIDNQNKSLQRCYYAASTSEQRLSNALTLVNNLVLNDIERALINLQAGKIYEAS